MKKKIKNKKKINNKIKINSPLNIFANLLMIIGFIIILIPIIYFIFGYGIIPADISLVGIILGLIGVFLSRKIHKN